MIWRKRWERESSIPSHEEQQCGPPCPALTQGRWLRERASSLPDDTRERDDRGLISEGHDEGGKRAAAAIM